MTPFGTLLTTDDSIDFMHGRKQLADSLASKNITIAPGVYDGISAHLVENVGFETGFLSGAGVSNSRLARPDIGFINQTEIAAQTRDITDMVDIPIWVDADTEEAHLSVNMGFGIRSRPTTPLIPAKELEDLGVDSVIYPRLITAAATKGMKDALESLETAVETHDEYQEPDKLVSWDYYMDLIGQPEMQRLEQEFAKK